MLPSTKGVDMTFIRKHLASVVIGALAVGGVSYMAAQAATGPQQLQLAQDSTPQQPDRQPAGPRAGGGPGAGLGRAIRGEAVVGTRQGEFKTVKFDRGTLDSVDGTTLVIKEADGTTVRVATDDNTKFRRDREQAQLSDLKAGDHVAALQVKDGDSYTTKFVRAFSPEKFAELQQQRQDRRAQRKGANG
jgi:hypothetical protein